MTTLTLHPHFIFITLSTTGYVTNIANALRDASIASGVVRSSALYAYTKDVLQVRRIVNSVVSAGVNLLPFTWPVVVPSDWIEHFTPVDEPWSLRYRNGFFEAWNGEKWVVRDIIEEADDHGYQLDHQRLALALSGIPYRRRWCCMCLSRQKTVI